MSFVLSNEHMNNLSNDMISTIKELSLLTMLKLKLESNLNNKKNKLKFEKQIWMNIMSFYSDLNKQAKEVKLSQGQWQNPNLVTRLPVTFALGPMCKNAVINIMCVSLPLVNLSMDWILLVYIGWYWSRWFKCNRVCL